MGLPNKKPQPPDTIPEAEVEVLEAAGPPDSLSEAEVEIIAAPRDLTAPAPSPHTGAIGAKGSQPQPQSLPSQGSGSLTPPTGHPQPMAAGNNNPPPRPTPRPPIFAPNQSIEILPRGEAISPLPPPGMPAAPIPKGLQGPPSKTPPGEFPRFGPGQDLPTPGPLPGFQGVQPGLEKMARNFGRFSYGTSAAGLGGSPLQTTPTAPVQLDPDAWRPPDWRGRLGAAADVVEGFEEASGPYIIPALAAGAIAGGPAAAILIAGNVALGYGGEELTRRGMEAAGVDPRIAKFTSKVVGWGPVEKMPGYSHAITGAAEALIPNSPTKQFSEGLGKSVEEFNSLVDELAKMDPQEPGYGKLAQDLAQGEVQLGMAANTLAQANLLGAIKSAQIMGKLRKVPQAESGAGAPGVDMAPALGPDTSLPAPDIIPAEPPATPYKSGTTQYNLPDDLAARVQFMGEQIPEESLAPQGRESQPHLTIRYGLGEDPQTSLPKIRQALADQGPITVTLGETTLFPDRGNGEVVKIDLAQSPELEAIREKLAQAGVDHIPDKGDALGYSPHITVAYVKPGEGQKFVGPSPLTGQELVIDRLWVGDRQGNQYEVPFGKSLEGILQPEQEAIWGMIGEDAGQESPAQPKFQIRDNTYLIRDDLHPKLMNTISKSRGNWPDRILPQDALNRLANAGLKKEELAWHQDGLIKELQTRAKDSPNTPVTQEEIWEWALADTPYVQERIRDQSPVTASEIQEVETRYTQKQAELAKMRQEISTYTLASLPDELYDKYQKLNQEVVVLRTMLARRRAPQDDTKFATYSTGGPEQSAHSYRERLFIAPDIPNPPRTHWQEPGVFLHTRESDRVGPDGQKIFFVDEVQSDWAQKGRAEGYKETPETHYSGVTRMPFPDSWAEMAIRRTLQAAAREGYQKFQWLGGKAQADRYSLRRVVDRLEYIPATHRLMGFNSQADPSTDIVDKIVSPEDLPNYIGKEIADRLLASPLRDYAGPDPSGPGKHILEGTELEVGGKFHQTLYDIRIPSYVKKLTKQQPRKIEITDGRGEILEAWEIDITPEVRAKMSQPQPLFHVTQTSQAPSQAQLWTPDQLAKSLPGYKLDLLPNDNRTNPGGATLGIETPSGKWAKLIVTRGKDLPTDPNAIATQLGRPAQPGDIVMGQYESRGLREQSVITLAGAAGPETLDHELFHYAFDTFLTPQEQAAILAAHGSEEAAAIAYGQGKGGLDPAPPPPAPGPAVALAGTGAAAGAAVADAALARMRQLFQTIHNKFYPDSKATLEALRKGQIWERQARYGVDTRGPVYRKPDGSLDWSLESMGKSFLETFDRNLVRFESNEPVYLAAALAAPGTAQSISREALIGPAQEIARAMHAGGYGQGSLQKGWVAFAEVLIDNRLAGVQGRWNDLAAAVEKATQKELRKGLARNSEGPDGALIRVLDRIDADQPMANGNSRAAKAREFLANKDFAGAKLYLGSIFRHNAYAVKRLDLKTTHGKTLPEFAQDPQFQQALQVYKSKVEALMAKQFLKNEGMLSMDLGPLDTYYPLVPQELGDMPVWQQSARERGYWIRPHNPSNYFTTGLSTKGYDPELSTFRSRLTAVIRGGNTKQFMDVLIGTGLAVKVTDSGAATAVFRGGEELPVDVIPLGSAQSISIKGQALKVPPQYVAVPKALGPTIRSVVLGEGPGGSSAFHSESFTEDVVNRISGWSLVGPADAAFHAQAVLSSLVAGTPHIRMSNTFLTVMANLPIAKSFTAMYTTFRRPAEYFVSDEGAKKLLHIAQIGAANPRIGSVAWDKDFADLFGAEWKPPLTDRSAWRRTPEERADADAAQFSQAQGIKAKAAVLGRKLASYMDVAGRIGDLGTSALVFGHPGEAAGAAGSGAPSWIRNHMIGLDLRARVALYDTHRALFPDAPQADLANFINQAMQYNWGLQSHFEQYIKGYAGTRLTSVFFTAGYSMIRAGVRAMNPVGTTHGLNRLDPIGRQQIFRAQRAFSGGVTGMTAAWALLNFAASGGRHWPWDQDQPDGPVPVGYIRLPQDIRESAPGRVLMGDPAKGSPKQGYVPMGFFNPPVWKGSTATGIRPGIDTAMLLGKAGIMDPVGRQLIALEALRGSMNTFLHPLLSGPIPRAGLAAMGMSPWIGPLWDPLTGRNQFTLKTESRAAPSLFAAAGMAAARAAGQMSPAVNWMNESGMEIGFGQPLSGNTPRDDGAAWAKTAADMMVPRGRPIGMDIRKKAEQARELVVKRKRLLQKQAGGQ